MATAGVADEVERFGVRTISAAGVCVVVARGELDRAAGDHLAGVLEQALDTRGPVLVDLCDVTGLDTAAIRALLGTRTRVQGAGRRFAIACPPRGPARHTLELDGLRAAFNLFNDRHSALAALRGG